LYPQVFWRSYKSGEVLPEISLVPLGGVFRSNGKISGRSDLNRAGPGSVINDEKPSPSQSLLKILARALVFSR
jgi:hypothetical protein